MRCLAHELHLARGDGSLPRLLSRWAKIDVLIDAIERGPRPAAGSATQ